MPDASAPTEPLPCLARATARLDADGVRWRSLARDRDRATPPAHSATQLLARHGTDSATAAAFDAAFARVVEAIHENFPDNIFWDLDRLAAELLAPGEPGAIQRRGARIEGLQRGFGRHGKISFRYAHDFLFGFDWARWVGRDPETRTAASPFGDAFLAYLEQRMHELVELIQRGDDTKYPRLEDTQPWRNPFGFSRDPDDEARLFERLAVCGAIPVAAWDASGDAVWNRPYSQLRLDAARALGMADEPPR